MADFPLANNDILIIAPKPALIDWVNDIFPEEEVPYPEPFEHDSMIVFLIPEFDHHSQMLEWLEGHFEDIFYEMLFGWCSEDVLFPPLTWEKFQEYC